MTNNQRQFVEYAVKTSMPGPSNTESGEPTYDSYQASRGSVITLHDNPWEDEVTVYLGNGKEIGKYELESEEGPKTLDRIINGSLAESGNEDMRTAFVDGEEDAEDYTIEDVLEPTIGAEATEEVLSKVGIEQAPQLNGVYRGNVTEGEEPDRTPIF
ncbi:MAG: hypothetical protein BRC29_01535 [Nanohaloarchaea archaeon SW_7_43_1]|nr:MAG: hypothetical protein BRC29_01535 [Nanohaloarchaea archaeon SW_7_43_1]